MPACQLIPLRPDFAGSERTIGETMSGVHQIPTGSVLLVLQGEVSRFQLHPRRHPPFLPESVMNRARAPFRLLAEAGHWSGEHASPSADTPCLHRRLFQQIPSPCPRCCMYAAGEQTLANAVGTWSPSLVIRQCQRDSIGLRSSGW